MQKITEGVLQLVHLAAFLVLSTLIVNTKSFPFTDDWTYITPLNAASFKEFMAWVFEQNVDHTIPIQKLTQYILARFSGYDFRILILTNLIIALLASLLLTSAAKNYRGYQRYGDAIIPMILMIPTASFSQWAFELQFLSSIFFVSTGTYCACKHAQTGDSHYITSALLQLLLCALCGLNGAIFSTIITAMLAAYFFYPPNRQAQSFKLHVALAALVLAENAIIWLRWKPSGASTMPADLAVTLEYFTKLLPSSMVVFTNDNTLWKSAAIVAGLALAAYSLYCKTKREKVNFADAFLAFSIIASLAVVLSTALARSKTHGSWNVGLAMHYGYLTVMLPIASWLLISHIRPSAVVGLVGLASLALFALAYQENYYARDSWEQLAFEKRLAVNQALKESTDLQALANKYITEFYWREDMEYKQLVAKGIETLRAHKFQLYTLSAMVPVDGQALTVETLPQDRCDGSIELLNGKGTANFTVSAPAQVSAATLLELSGWFAASGNQAGLTRPATVYAVLTDPQGERKYLRTRSISRFDVATNYNNPKLSQSGYASLADISSLKGQYVLGLALQEADTIKICPRFNIPVTITP